MLKYKEEIIEDKLFKQFYEDTKDGWTQRESPSHRELIKWLIIKGYLRDDIMKGEI